VLNGLLIFPDKALRIAGALAANALMRDIASSPDPSRGATR
jgi:hypothetical protein